MMAKLTKKYKFITIILLLNLHIIIYLAGQTYIILQVVKSGSE